MVTRRMIFMNDIEKPDRGIDRRSFLKGAVATGAVAAVSTVPPLSAAQSEKETNAAAASWRDRPEPIDETLISDGGTYDVVVVGGGNAGQFCARAASMNGASVAVIENQAEKNYVRGIGSQCGTVNSRYVLDQGAPRIDEADFLREVARRNVIRHNPKRASYFVKNSGRIFDWAISITTREWMDKHCHLMSWPPKGDLLMETSGWKFYHGCATFRNFDLDYEPWSEFVRMHQEKSMADGAEWFNEHHAEICDADDSGAVTGVVAKKADGTYVRFRARKGVALCAGGFAGNREMVIDILDTVRHEAEARGDLGLIRGGNRMGSPRDGSGLKMGIWAGGHVEIGPHSTLNPNGEPGCGVWYLQLDHKGERFCDEAAGSMIAQPIGTPRVTLYDANWKTAMLMMPPRHTAPDHAEPTELEARLTHLDNIKPGPLSKEDPSDQNGRIRIRYGLPGVSGDTCCANTIEELLDYMECYEGDTKKKALDVINRYNEMCEKGVDEDFGKDPRVLKVTALKDPPFYATVETYGGGSGMFGLGAGMSSTTGLDTDADGHVLDSDFKPINGLYAAGNNAGGRFIVVYQSLISGISIGMAMTEGYMLGERLAKL